MKSKKQIIKISSKGFTLLELLVVVLIIGILAAIALPQYRRAKDKAKYSTVIPIVKAVSEAMDRYYLIHNKYPTKLNDIDINLAGNSINRIGTHDFINFDWGSCYFGWSKQFVCILGKEEVAFSYYPDENLTKCYAYGQGANTRAYKFCASVPNAKLENLNSSCRWIDQEIRNCSIFRLK